MIKEKWTNLLSLLLAVLFVFGILGVSSPAQAESFGKAGDALPEWTGDAESETGLFERSPLKPYYEDGRPFPSLRGSYTPSDDFSIVRVLLNFEKNISVTSATIKLYGAYYIDQNLKPIVGTQAQPATVRLTAYGNSVTVYYGGSAVYQGGTVDINRVLLGVDGGYANIETTPETQISGSDFLGSFRITANSGKLRIVNHVPTAHYLYGVVPYEMNDSWGLEALMCQAIASKGYAFAYPAEADDHDITAYKEHQWYRGYRPGFENAKIACSAVAGEMLFYNGNTILTFFDATNGGETNLPSYAFGSSYIDDAYSIVRDSMDLQYCYPHMLDLEIKYGQPITNANFRTLINDELYAAVGHSVQLLSIIHAEVNTRAFPDTELNLTKLDLIVRIIDNGVERSQFLRFNVNKLGRNGYGVLVPQYNRVYRMYWGEEITNGYVVHHCRYGNGIGLSQQAAKGRCANGQDHYQIIDFYYPNMDLLNVTERDPEFPYSYSKQIIAYGSINTNSVRLRGGPSTNDPILETMPLGTHIDVVGETNGWLICIANNKLGYVRGDLVDITLYPAPLGGEFEIGTSTVRPGVSDAVLRTGPSQYCDEVYTLPAGASMTVWHRIGDWYHVRYAGRFLYIHSSKITSPRWIRSKLIPDPSQSETRA